LISLATATNSNMEAQQWLEIYLPDQKCFYKGKLLDVDSGNGNCLVRFESLAPPELVGDKDVEWVRWEHIRSIPAPLQEPHVPVEVRRAARPACPSRYGHLSTAALPAFAQRLTRAPPVRRS
jgi:hypothetical protein